MSTSSQHNLTEPAGSPDSRPDDLAIYDHFWRLCRLTVQGMDCDGRPVYTWCRRVPEDWEPVIVELLATFGEERLESSGIAQRQEEGQWTLTPAVAPGSMLVALWEGEEGPIFEILTPRGGLVGEEIPVIAALRDYRFRDWVPKTGNRLLVGSSTEQVPPFLPRALPTTTLYGLSQLNSQQLRDVGRQLGWRILKPNRHSEPAASPVRLILLGWDPKSVQIRQDSQVHEAAEFLANAERDLRFASHAAVWLPSEEELRRYQFCRNVRDLNATREALVESMDTSCYSASAYVTPGFAPRREPGNVVEAYADLEQCLDRATNTPVTAERLREAEGTFQRLVEADLVQPLQRQALESRDPIQRNLAMIAADTFRSLHRQAPYLGRELDDLAKGALSVEDRKRVVEEASHRERLIAILIRLAKLQGR